MTSFEIIEFIKWIEVKKLSKKDQDFVRSIEGWACGGKNTTPKQDWRLNLCYRRSQEDKVYSRIIK